MRRSPNFLCGVLCVVMSEVHSLNGAPAPLPADLIIHNATIITVNSNQPTARAIAIRGEEIIAVGADAAVRQSHTGAGTKLIDAGGRVLMPGIYDSHVHSYRAAVSELGEGAPLVASIAEAQAWIRQQAEIKPPGSWIVLQRVYASRLKEERMPTKAELDVAAPDHPVHWNSGPVSMVNTRALEVSGITRETPSPLPAEIVKDETTGEPTGLLRGAAHLLKAPASAYVPSPEEHRAAVKQLHAFYNQHGITSIAERRADPEAIDLFRAMAGAGELTVRVNGTRIPPAIPQNAEQIGQLLDQMAGVQKSDGAVTLAAAGHKYGPTGAGDDWVRIGPLKVFLDGGVLIGTAYMREPWGVTGVYQIKDPEYRGQLNVKPGVLHPFYLEAARRGWQLTAHCTGEASPDVLLDCYEFIQKQIDIRDRRFLITHANFQSAENLERCRKLGVAADIQPAWLYKDGASLLKILGERRMKWFQPLKSWWDSGLVIGGGSDHMVQLDSINSTNPWNPWLGMWIAITRQTERGGVLNPDEKLTREQAIRFYTINNAYLHFEEKRKGSLEPGKLADLIMIDRDILTCPVDEIKDTKVLLTMVGGRVVWGRGDGR